MAPVCQCVATLRTVRYLKSVPTYSQCYSQKSQHFPVFPRLAVNIFHSFKSIHFSDVPWILQFYPIFAELCALSFCVGERCLREGSDSVGERASSLFVLE